MSFSVQNVGWWYSQNTSSQLSLEFFSGNTTSYFQISFEEHNFGWLITAHTNALPRYFASFLFASAEKPSIIFHQNSVTTIGMTTRMKYTVRGLMAREIRVASSGESSCQSRSLLPTFPSSVLSKLTSYTSVDGLCPIQKNILVSFSPTTTDSLHPHLFFFFITL